MRTSENLVTPPPSCLWKDSKLLLVINSLPPLQMRRFKAWSVVTPTQPINYFVINLVNTSLSVDKVKHLPRSFSIVIPNSDPINVLRIPLKGFSDASIDFVEHRSSTYVISIDPNVFLKGLLIDNLPFHFSIVLMPLNHKI